MEMKNYLKNNTENIMITREFIESLGFEWDSTINDLDKYFITHNNETYQLTVNKVGCIRILHKYSVDESKCILFGDISMESLEFFVNNVIKTPYKKVYVTQDDSSHWYVIPIELASDFSEDLEDEDFDFDAKYGKYRTGGDINNVKLYMK